MNDSVGQLPNEFYHYALLALLGGITISRGIISWLGKRELAAFEKAKAAQDLAHSVLREQFEAHVRRSGMEIKDVQYKMGIMASQVQRVIPEVDIPEWPDR